jgi:transcriptional regulator with XRE-family HTH domain
MSGLYLILRHRLDDVTDWVMIESSVLRDARTRLRLSYETVARRLHVSSKTYERYEKKGRIPRNLVPTIAAILELEIESAMPRPLKVTDTWTATDDLGAEIIARLDRIEKLLQQQPAS